MRKHICTLLLSFCVLIALSATAAYSQPQNLVTNGGFETPVVPSSIETFFASSTFGGWTVSGHSVDLVSRTNWMAADGGQSLALSGQSAGAVHQDLVTVPGQSYRLRFAPRVASTATLEARKVR